MEAQSVAHQRLAGADKTLLHADLHLDNLVFVNGTEPVYLDWARWQPASSREAMMIDVGLLRALNALNYWAANDPALFSLL